MRLSTNERDPGYAPDAFKGVRVTVDGVEMSDIITADDEGGWVRTGTEVRRGKVEITTARGGRERPAPSDDV